MSQLDKQSKTFSNFCITNNTVSDYFYLKTELYYTNFLLMKKWALASLVTPSLTPLVVHNSYQPEIYENTLIECMIMV